MRYIWEAESTGHADGLDVRVGREVSELILREMVVSLTEVGKTDTRTGV